MVLMLVPPMALASPTPSKPKLFLFAGQSNMVGMGDWSLLTTEERASVSNVRVFTADTNHAPPISSPTYFQYWVPPQGVFSNYAQWRDAGLSWNATNPAQPNSVTNFGPEFTTVRDLASGLGEHIYFAKYALAGTGLDASFSTVYGTWNPLAADPGAPAEYSQSLYHSMVSWANKALAAARQIEPDTELAGFFWLQGEIDAFYTTTASKYNTNLTNFIQRLRSDLGIANLPIVIGRITNMSTTMPAANTVRKAQADVVAKTTYSVLVDTDGLAMDPDYQLHYLASGLKTVGQRFAQAWLDLKRPPALTNGTGATNVLAASATLSGNLIATGGASTTVSIFWGLSDGGTDSTAWGHSVNLGARTAGSFTTNVSGLVAGGFYYYRCRALNAYGETWSGPSGSFTTLPVTSAITGSTLVQSGQAGVIYAVTPTSGSCYAWTVPGGASITAGQTGPNNNQITVTFGGMAGNISVIETNAAAGVGTPVTLAVVVNHAPLATPVFVWTPGAAEQSIAIIGGTQTPQDEDAGDAGNLTVTAIGTAAHGTVSVNADHKGVTYTANAGYTGGADTFTYTVGDGRGGSATATLTVGVGTVAKALNIYRNDSGVTVNFKGVPGLPFTVERAQDLCFTLNMTSLGSLTADSETGLFSITDAFPPAPTGFYRARYP